MKNIIPPKAKVKGHFLKYHGEDVEDGYFWLREKENEEVIAYLEEENAYTKEVMAHKEDFSKELYDEMVGRIKETDLSVPVKKDDYFYYSRTEKGKNYRIYCRKHGSLEADEEVLLDGNVLAEGKKYFSISSFKVSDDHSLLAFSVDFDGSEEYVVSVKDLVSGEMLEDVIEKTAGAIVWANDNKTFFYTTLDETHRPYRLHRHVLGTAVSEDVVVLEEVNGAYFLHPYKSKSKAFIFVHLGSKVTTEVHYLDANDAMGDFKVFAERMQNEEYKVTHHGDTFYVLTNDNALNFKLMTVPVGKTSRGSWRPFIEHDDDVLLSDVEAFRDHLVIYGRKKGLKSIAIVDLESMERHDVVFPEPVYTFWEGSNPDFNSVKLRFQYSSLITPRTVFDYDVTTREFEKLKEFEVQGDYDRSLYTMERSFARATDGTMIPISLTYRKDLVKDGSNACYLYGYGSYGHSMDPYFSSVRLSLMERGVVFAMAHVRGGSEMGRKWYEDGKFLNKKNTFTDFIACSIHLIEEGFTNNNRLCISGGSAGGLLMGAVVNMRPDLYKAVVASVPFVDVINTMMDESIPLTVVEYEEWGNPNDKVYFDYMRSYSPYDNVRAVEYPNMLITAGLNDPRVQYWEPAKWVAKLRTLNTGSNRLLLKTNMGAGHGGASGRYEALKELSFEYAFVLDCLGVV